MLRSSAIHCGYSLQNGSAIDFMRVLFLVVVLANLGVLALGQGFFGPAPIEQGREARHLSERNQQAVQLGEPRADY